LIAYVIHAVVDKGMKRTDKKKERKKRERTRMRKKGRCNISPDTHNGIGALNFDNAGARSQESKDGFY
jgi:hypothetical protein